jgi:peptidyl-prolyl cis-trans isomerase D
MFAQTETGYMVPPHISNDNFLMMKITGIKFAPDSVKARHILLATTKTNKDEVRASIDSLKKVVQEGADFASLAAQLSVDPGSKEQGGDLGWFQEGFMIPVINDSCFSAEVNKLMTVESPFGIHLLQVTEKSPVVKKIQVAVIQRAIDASKETMDEKFTASNEFSIDAENGQPLKELAVRYDAAYNTIDIRENDHMLPDVESSRGLIRWAYNAEVGDVSEAQQFGNSFVVAKLLEVHEDGIAPLEAVRTEAEMGAIKAKKAAMLAEQMKGQTSLESAASALGVSVEHSENIVFESYSIPGLGREPYVLGKIFSMSAGDLSVPLKGENGVFIVKVEKVDEAPQSADFTSTKNQIGQNRSSRVNYEVFEALKDRVEIEDYRFKFY